MIRRYLLLLTMLFSSPAICGTYQPDDPAAYREPNKLACSGLKDYPKGIRLDVPQNSTVGNLEEGLQYLYPEGKVAIYVFEFFGQGGSKEVEFHATRIDLLNWQRSEYKGLCNVSRWYPASTQ